MKKVAFLISHPIQYNSPLFEEFAKEDKIDFEVLYCSQEGLEGLFDKGFERQITWDIPLLEGYRYRFLRNHSLKPGIGNGFFGLMNLGICRELRGRDAVIIHSWHYATHIIAILCAYILSVKVFLRIEWPIQHEVKKRYWKRLLKKFIVKTLFFNAEFLAVGESHKKGFLHYGVAEERIHSFPYAIDNARFDADFLRVKEQRLKIRKELGLKDDDVAVIFVGKLQNKKRPFDLLSAISALGRDDVHLFFVGDGHLRESLEAFVLENKQTNIHFLGFKNQTELAACYIFADIFVLPSGVGETWGLVVNEAMCFSLPIVLSDLVGCSSDLVKSGENGYIYPSEDILALKSCLQKLVESKELREQFGKKSKAIISNYTYQKDVESVVNKL